MHEVTSLFKIAYMIKLFKKQGTIILKKNSLIHRKFGKKGKNFLWDFLSFLLMDKMVTI